MEKAIVSSNRVNIPAICRIPGRGTAFLVSPGILLTSARVIGSKEEALENKAIFFESGKQSSVSVPLLPDNYLFVSAFPSHLDYCLVACDTKHIFGVKPIKLPILLDEIPSVMEGDMCLIVQHPIHPQAQQGDNLEVKRFDEVLRVKEDTFSFQMNTNYDSFGCPVFNTNGQLLGVHSQYRTKDGETINQAVHLRSIVQHLFANRQLFRIESKATFSEIRKCWASPRHHHNHDFTTFVQILFNFPLDFDVCKPAFLELCRHLHDDQLEPFVKDGGIAILLKYLELFKDLEEIVSSGLRALWSISLSLKSSATEIVSRNGLNAILTALNTFPNNEKVAEYSIVLLFNISSHVDLVSRVVDDNGLFFVLKTMETFVSNDVVFKFGFGAINNFCQYSGTVISTFVRARGVSLIRQGLQRFGSNEYLNEFAITLIDTCSTNEAFQTSPDIEHLIIDAIRAITQYVSNPNVAFHGNRALWNLGLIATNRIVICEKGGIDCIQKSLYACRGPFVNTTTL